MSRTMSRVAESRPPGVSMRMTTTAARRSAASSSVRRRKPAETLSMGASSSATTTWGRPSSVLASAVVASVAAAASSASAMPRRSRLKATSDPAGLLRDLDRPALPDDDHFHLPRVLELVFDLARDLVREEDGAVVVDLRRLDHDTDLTPRLE